MFEIAISQDYIEFLRREIELRKLSKYEKACKFAEKVLPIPVGKGRREKYQSAINFVHMKVTPRGVFDFSILITVVLIALSLIPIYYLGFSAGLLILLSTILFSNFMYWYNYPFYVVNAYRVKASSEMILSVIYMTVAMRMKANLENAILFTSENLSGPLSLDLKELIWGVYTARYKSAVDALDALTNKWRVENEEFGKAINLIKNSSQETITDREKILDEAVSVALEGTKERMKNYAQDLKAPLTVLNAMGILLPLIGLIFFPIFMLFLPELIRPIFIVAGYNVILPIAMYWMMSATLMKRPYTFHQPDVSKHPKFEKEKRFGNELIIGIILGIILMSIGFYKIFTSQEQFSFGLLASSIFITWGVATPIIIYTLVSSGKLLKLRNEFVQIENELGTALFQIGHHIKGGVPIENSIKESIPRMGGLKIAKMFEVIVYNIETFGMTLQAAVFDKISGAIRYYPSKLIGVVMKALIEISKSGMNVLSKSMIAISNYLKDMHNVNEFLKEMLSEVTSTMKLQAMMLAPISAGIVVGLAAMMTNMLVSFSYLIEPLQQQLGEYGPIGSAGNGVFDSLLNLNRLIPIQYFQLIVGIYLIEIVAMLAVFLNTIENGEENILKRQAIGKMLLNAMIIYSFGIIVLYIMINTVMPLTVLTG